jgi:predicted transposase YbfD/YdcC
VLHPKKVGTLLIEGCDKEKQTNEIKIAIPLLDSIDISGKTITADALLTQRNIASYIVSQRNAHYHFTAKGNQKQLMEDIAFCFKNIDRKPDFSTVDSPDHGRIETRNIWTTTDMNDYLDFPYVGQVFMVERTTFFTKSGKERKVITYGLTSKTSDMATAKDVLKDNRGHWSIENSCHYIIDWNYDEDRSRIVKGYGPENITRLRRFAVGLLKSKGVSNVSQKMRQLLMTPRMVLDYLKMTRNSRCASKP